MKEDKKDYGIYINKKIPNNDNKINKYYKNIRLDFKGKAFITNKGLTLEREIKNGEQIKRNGNYIVKFINEKGQIFFINIKVQKINLFFILLLLTLITLSFLIFLKPILDIREQIIFDSLGYDYIFIGDRYVFNVKYGEEDSKRIILHDKVTNQAKIYPGASGSFLISINTVGGNKEIEYNMQIEQEENKPSNLKFKIGENEYTSMNDLSKAVNGKIKENMVKKIKIDWYWDFESEDDDIDTLDGTNHNNYSFIMSLTGM